MASDESAPHVQLNQLDGGGGYAPVGGPGGGGNSNLASTKSGKRKAANHIETDLAPATKKAGALADSDTGGVTGVVQGPGIPTNPSINPSAAGSPSAGGGAFADWSLQSGLTEAHSAWESQVRNLLNRLTSERDALRATNNILHGNDGDTGLQLQGVKTPHSKLSDLY
ncbi:hypothetical protein J7E87_23975 [Streptomyces sp. ISL-1]|uniref:hypothetical protein n=1 Tax=Streptomyces sp. ISL-1 TaxID=2817657 RepID=UPI001BE57D31|nr:hypothetical protein [Streptomyces sp. ISL-1]MBT2392398.1 hypothetical protein [Streptomyces sp. ISL-1]